MTVTEAQRVRWRLPSVDGCLNEFRHPLGQSLQLQADGGLDRRRLLQVEFHTPGDEGVHRIVPNEVAQASKTVRIGRRVLEARPVTPSQCTAMRSAVCSSRRSLRARRAEHRFGMGESRLVVMLSEAAMAYARSSSSSCGRHGPRRREERRIGRQILSPLDVRALERQGHTAGKVGIDANLIQPLQGDLVTRANRPESAQIIHRRLGQDPVRRTRIRSGQRGWATAIRGRKGSTVTNVRKGANLRLVA